MMRISRFSVTDVAHYREHGYLLPKDPVFTPARFAALRNRYQTLDGIWTQQYHQRSEAFDKPHFLFPELFDYLLDPALLDLVEPLIGPDIGLFSSHFICKPAGTGQRVPWHEDSAYWSGIFDSVNDICTLWLAIDPSDSGNGCLRVIDQSHTNGYSTYQAVRDQEASVFGTEITSDAIDESKAVDFELQPNFCSLHHARMIHGSNANRSNRRRCGLSIRYFSTRHRFLGGPMPESFRIYLARGVDHSGNCYADPVGVNQAWVDAMLEGQLPEGHL
jgi:hypothetical protein